MNRSVPYQLTLLFLTVLVAGGMVVQPASGQADRVRFERISVEDGLSQNTVQVALQDHFGFLWFGTEDGLNKYDGSQFTIFRHNPDDPSSISNSNILSLLEDQAGVIWVGTKNGLNRFDRDAGQFQSIPSIPGSSIFSLAEDQDRNLWIGTELGLFRLNPERTVFAGFESAPGDLSSLSPGAVRVLWIDPLGTLWIGTDSGGLDRWDAESGGFTHLNPIEPSGLKGSVRALALDKNGDVWIGTCGGKGLYRYQPVSRILRFYNHRGTNQKTIPNDCIRSLTTDTQGALWLGTENGAGRWDVDQTQMTGLYRQDANNPDSLGSDQINTLFFDRSGILWVGTTGGGLGKHSPYTQKFGLLRHVPNEDDSLSGSQVQAIFQAEDGNLWIGSMDAGLDILDRDTGQFIHYSHNPGDGHSLSSDQVSGILQDPRGSIWVGTRGAGLNRFDPNGQEFTRFVHKPRDPSSLNGNQVDAMHLDRNGDLWIGTLDGGLDRYDPSTETFIHYPLSIGTEDSPGQLSIREIFEDQTGKFWLAAEQGLYQYDPRSQELLKYSIRTHENVGAFDETVLSYYQQKDGTLWFGTTTGLYYYNPDTGAASRYTQSSGLPNDTINCILADSTGNMWVSTNNGLSRFDPVANIFRNFDTSDGLQSAVFNPGACYQNDQGELFFGGIEGLNWVMPTQIQENPLAPPIVVTSLKVFNQELYQDLGASAEQVNLTYQDNFISFEFAGLDFSAPQKNQYAYMLEGFDPDWIPAGTRRYASYTNLAGGDYIFRVKGSNNDGLWNQAGISIPLHITPPFWETLWFRGLVFVSISLLVYSLYRFRINQIQGQTLELAHQVEERTTELRQEIQQRSETEKALRTSESRYRDLVENANSIILRWDNTGKITFFNRYAQLFFGYPRDEILGKSVIGTIVPEEDSSGKSMRAWIDEIVEQPNGFFTTENENMTSQGKKVWVAWTNKAIYDQEGNISEVLSIGIDRTAQKLAEEALNRQTEQAAVSGERSRLARELHDAVSQTLFSTSLIADVLPRIWERNPDEGRRRLDEIRQLTRGALAEMRTLLLELRPNALVDAEMNELFRHLADAFTGRTRVPVDLEVSFNEETDFDLPADVKICYYRVTQEALNNIAKHAGATRVAIRLYNPGKALALEIRDDGRGFDPESVAADHFGVQIMRERCESIGAEYSLTSLPQAGTSIQVKWSPRTNSSERG